MSETQRYTSVAIALHWILAVLLVGMVFYGWWMEDLREQALAGEASLSLTSSAFNWHKTVGILIFVLSLARLAWRLTHRPPALPEALPFWQKAAARSIHVAFYAAMLGIPIGGYVVASAYSQVLPILFFDQIALPKLPVPQTSDFRELAGSVHGAGGWVILVLLALHVGAALKHHLIDRDGVLLRMIPFLNIPSQK